MLADTQAVLIFKCAHVDRTQPMALIQRLLHLSLFRRSGKEDRAAMLIQVSVCTNHHDLSLLLSARLLCIMTRSKAPSCCVVTWFIISQCFMPTQAGADVNAVNSQGSTPLHLATVNGECSIDRGMPFSLSLPLCLSVFLSLNALSLVCGTQSTRLIPYARRPPEARGAAEKQQS